MKIFRFFLPLVLSDLASLESDKILPEEQSMIVFHKAIFLLFQKSRNDSDCQKKLKILKETLEFLEKNKDDRWSEENLLLGEIKLGNFSAKLADEIIVGKPFCEEEFELFVKSIGRSTRVDAREKILNDYAVIFSAKCDARRLEYVLQEGRLSMVLVKVVNS